MALGYAPTVRDVLAYYGPERPEVARALARAAQGRAVEFMDWPIELDWLSQRQEQSGPLATDPSPLAACVRRHLRANMGSFLPADVPPRYPGLHGTIAGDIVLEIDDRNSQRAAFEGGKRIREFLESYGVPYRIKFSGNCSPHFIIPRDLYEPLVPQAQRGTAYAHLSAWFFSRLKDQVTGKLDDAVCGSTGHLRLAYSLHERTGLVSLPIRPEQYDDFHPVMAEMQNVRVEEWWFEREDLQAKREGMQRILWEVEHAQ